MQEHTYEVFAKRLAQKETYTTEEKKMLMERLDEERRIQQEIDNDITHYNEEEKSKILRKLDEERLTKEKHKDIEKRRLENKESYKFGTKNFYKLLMMEREYYIEIDACKKLSSRPTILSLYYRTFDELKKKDVLVKTEVYSDKIFISYNAIRVYFKAYTLEEKHKK